LATQPSNVGYTSVTGHAACRGGKVIGKAARRSGEMKVSKRSPSTRHGSTGRGRKRWHIWKQETNGEEHEVRWKRAGDGMSSRESLKSGGRNCMKRREGRL